MKMMMACSWDDISSIDSSTCRNSKRKDELILAQKAVILSLSDEVSKLASNLQAQQQEMEAREEEMKIRDRTESDLESKNLYLMIENAQLKNQVADLKDGLSSNENLGWQSSTKPTTTFSSDDKWTFTHDEYLPFEYLDDQSDESNRKENFTPPHDGNILSLPKLSRRKSMVDLSKINLAPRVRNPLSRVRDSTRFNTAQSLLTSMKGKKITWKDKRPKLIPRHVFFTAELVQEADEVSDVSV